VTTNIVLQLARACAHGVRQKQLVEELINGPVYIVQTHWGYGLGKANVDYQSWKNLKKRLTQNGFIISQESFKDKTGINRAVRMKYEVDFSSS
jgi:hypothetical protein